MAKKEKIDTKVEENTKETEKKSKKGLIVIIIVIILLLCISIGSGILLLNNMKDDNSEPTEQKENTNNEETKQDEETEEVKTFKVIFDSNGGSLVDMVTVNEGEVINKPENPTRDGYTFQNWTLDDKEYDFSTPVNSDITLKASWKKKTTSTSSSSSNSSSKSSSSSSSKNNSSTVTSTINKFNLNDYITITINYSDSYNRPIDYYFITNLDSVLPSLKGKKTIDLVDDGMSMTGHDLYTSKWDESLKKFTFDTAKENKAKTALNKLSSTKYKGLEFGGKFDSTTHSYYYKYSYITIKAPQYKKINDELTKIRNNALSDINTLDESAIKVLPSIFGVYPPWQQILDEDLCKEYNLTCGRW